MGVTPPTFWAAYCAPSHCAWLQPLSSFGPTRTKPTTRLPAGMLTWVAGAAEAAVGAVVAAGALACVATAAEAVVGAVVAAGALACVAAMVGAAVGAAVAAGALACVAAAAGAPVGATGVAGAHADSAARLTTSGTNNRENTFINHSPSKRCWHIPEQSRLSRKYGWMGDPPGIGQHSGFREASQCNPKPGMRQLMNCT